jgi:hypothetical protein
MHHRLEQLRLAIALAHAVPGGRLELTSVDGRLLLAGTDPSCDLDICSLRQVVLASAQRGLPDPSRYLTAFEISGSLQADAGGLHRADDAGRSSRWFATLLPADQVSEILSELPASSPAEQALEAGLRSDRCLGVTVVRLAVDTDRVGALWAEPALDHMALAAHARCLVEELVAGGRIGSTP